MGIIKDKAIHKESNRYINLSNTPFGIRKLHLVEAATEDAGLPVCYRTDQRYQCNKQYRSVRKDCVKLIAAWLRQTQWVGDASLFWMPTLQVPLPPLG